MAFTLEDKLVVAISSRALFDFEEENQVYETGDLAEYEALQRSRLSVPAKPGVAFPLIRKLLALNAGAQHVEVVILSRSDPISGLRAFSSCKAHGLAIERGVFTRGRAPFAYLKPLRASLFLSANPESVRRALRDGVAAATILPAKAAAQVHDQLRIAFDGDAVIFGDESERVSQQDGIAAFHAHNRRIDAYTVRRADDEGMAVIEKLLELKVDQITTDDPEGVAARLALNEAAYLSEILRGGILSVAKGQTEAARAMGLNPFQIFRLVILPQALRVIIPPLGNSVNGLLKTTSIASVISMEEVLRRGQILMQQKFQVLEIFMVVAIIYLAMTTCWDFVQRRIEAYYGKAYGAAANKQFARDDH